MGTFMFDTLDNRVCIVNLENFEYYRLINDDEEAAPHYEPLDVYAAVEELNPLKTLQEIYHDKSEQELSELSFSLEESSNQVEILLKSGSVLSIFYDQNCHEDIWRWYKNQDEFVKRPLGGVIKIMNEESPYVIKASEISMITIPRIRLRSY